MIETRLVQRPALADRLSAISPATVTLVCAPAGSGKTLLIRSWADRLDEPVAWVTVERGERDAQRFWLQVIDALAEAAPEDIEAVSPAPSFAGRAIVERLLSQLDLVRNPLVLVIDDLHELDSTEAGEWLELLLGRVPLHLRVVLATREEPGLGLHRLRVGGALTEIRGSDLRFSVDETRELLSAGGIALSDAATAALHERAEGWAAGLRLAAISLGGAGEDPERFVAEFSGSERTVAGYLLAEVLERQPSDARDLLLRTSILDRVNGPLADALTGGTGAEAVLQRLEEQNAFVTALDAGRSWFRYHHLFADLLRLELRRTAPELIESLHRAAADWHEQSGDVVQAIRHAQLAEDWPHAARLLVDNHFPLTIAGRSQTIDVLVESFPPEAATSDANLAVTLAVNRTLLGAFDEGAAYLEIARALAPSQTDERRHIFGVYLGVVGLELARRHGNLDHARAAMDELDAALAGAAEAHAAPVSPTYRALALMNLGIAELWSGYLDDGRAHLEESLAITRQIQLSFVEIGCLTHLALVGPLTGQPLPLAVEMSGRAIEIADEHGWEDEPMATPAFAVSGVALARLARFGEAEERLARAERALGTRGDPGTELALHLGRGLLAFSDSRYNDALAAFAHAQRAGRELPREHMLMVELENRRLQVQVRMGDTARARVALNELDPHVRRRAGIRVAAAALELAQDEPEQAVEELAPVLNGEAPALQVGWAQVEANLLNALAHDALGDARAVEESVERALDLAEPEALLLPFMLWPAGDVLERHPRHRSAHGALLTTILDLLAGSVQIGAEPEPLREELSEAELRVLGYLPSNLNATEIASELLVSANTVRTHIRHIYVKLGAHTRSEAVARARELGVLAPSSLRR